MHIKYFYIRYHPDERSLENEIIYKSYDERHLYVNLHRLQQCNQYSHVHFTLDLRLFSPWRRRKKACINMVSLIYDLYRSLVTDNVVNIMKVTTQKDTKGNEMSAQNNHAKQTYYTSIQHISSGLGNKINALVELQSTFGVGC